MAYDNPMSLGSFPVAQNPSTLQKVLDILGSKGGQTLVNAAGAGLQVYGAGKQAEADRAANSRQFAANMAERQYENDQAARQSAATTALSANPLGADQQFAQRNAILRSILGNARNVSYTPSDPMVAAAMPQHSGGMRLPEGGLDPAMLERLFGDNATQNSILQHSKNTMNVDPRFQAMPMESMFGRSADGSENANDTALHTYGANALQADELERARQREIIQRAIDEDIKGEKQPNKGSSIWKKLGKIGLIAGGGIATAMTGGAASPLLAAAIGAGTGAGLGALDGGAKGALTGALTGGITGGLVPGGGSAVKSTLGAAAKAQLKNPNIYQAAILGR